MAGSNLDLIVDVQVSRDVQPFSTTNFNGAMFISGDQVFAERYRQYSRYEDMLVDGFSAESDAYRAGRTYFQQSPRPQQLTIGRRDATVAVIALDVADVVNSTAYSLILQGKTFTYTSGASAESDKPAEIELIMDGLQALAVADSDVTDAMTVVSAGTGASATLTITEIADMTIGSVGPRLTATYTYESWANALNAILTENDKDWAISTYDHSVAGCLAIASELNARGKGAYFVSNSHADNLGTTVTADNLRAQLEAFSYDRVVFEYSATADETFLEMGHIGDKITALAGATTWDLSPVQGVLADKLTRTQINILDEKANYFTNYGGINYVRQGRVVSGEWIDTMRGADNLKEDLQIELVRVMASANKSGKKIPLTDEGVGILVGACEGIMQNYVARGFIKDSFSKTDAVGNVQTYKGYVVASSLVADLTSNQRASRQAPDIQIVAYLAGAVHKVKVLVNLFV